MKRILTVTFFCLISSLTFAEDNEITILAVSTGGANIPTAVAQLSFLQDNWPNNGGVTLNLSKLGSE